MHTWNCSQKTVITWRPSRSGREAQMSDCHVPGKWSTVLQCSVNMCYLPQFDRSVRVMDSSINGSIFWQGSLYCQNGILSKSVTPSWCVSSCHHDLKASTNVNLPTWVETKRCTLPLSWHPDQEFAIKSGVWWLFFLPWTVASSHANANGGGQKTNQELQVRQEETHICVCHHLCLKVACFHLKTWRMKTNGKGDDQSRMWSRNTACYNSSTNTWWTVSVWGCDLIRCATQEWITSNY